MSYKSDTTASTSFIFYEKSSSANCDINFWVSKLSKNSVLGVQMTRWTHRLLSPRQREINTSPLFYKASDLPQHSLGSANSYCTLKGQMHHHDDLGSKCAYMCHLSNKTTRKSVLLSTPQIWLMKVSKKLA